jgi:hypothetical protein
VTQTRVTADAFCSYVRNPEFCALEGGLLFLEKRVFRN